MKSLMGKIVDMSAHHKYAHVCRPTGHDNGRGPKRYTGYHKQMKPSELKVLALRLQREAAR